MISVGEFDPMAISNGIARIMLPYSKGPISEIGQHRRSPIEKLARERV